MNILLALISAALYVCAFPPVDFAAAAFIGLVPLLLVVRHASAKQALLIGWFTGTVACMALTSTSIYEAARQYFAQARWANLVFATVVPQVYGAPYFGIFALIARSILRRGSAWSRPLLVAAAWTACEFVRSSVGEGGPWLLLAHTQHATPLLLQIADVTGAYGVSFVIVAVNAGIAGGLGAQAGPVPDRSHPRAAGAATAAIVLMLCATYGALRLAQVSSQPTRSVKVAVIQPNLPSAWRRSLIGMPNSVRRLTDLTAQAAVHQPDLVVWPENAVGFMVSANESLFSTAAGALPAQGDLLLGAPRAVQLGSGEVVFRNSAFLLNQQAQQLAYYDKRHLTPFAETAPWEFLPLLGRRYARGDTYTPGDKATLFDTGRMRFGVMICFEAIYPELAGDLVDAGAELFVVISNDDWFAQRPALAQHLHASMFRAIELRRALVRSTNTGLSAVISPLGEVMASAVPATDAVLEVSVPLRNDRTVYGQVGDLFAWLCVAATVSLLVGNVWRRRRAAERSASSSRG